MYLLRGFCLMLTVLLALNVLASLVAAAVWRSCESYAQHWTATARARLIFALRMFPPVSALICVSTLFLPAYLIYEPHVTAESLGAKLAAPALVSTLGIALIIWRWLHTWKATQRLTADWLSHATPIQLNHVSIPAYRLPHPFPLIAVVGTLRPRLFIANHVLDALSQAELEAAFAHENGHLVAHDNFKRGLLHAYRDALTLLPYGRALDRVWAEASESAADEYAARFHAEATLDLASALVKIARLAPAGMRPTMPASASLLGGDAVGIASRVHRLTQLAEATAAGELQSTMNWRPIAWAGLGMLIFTAVWLTTHYDILAIVHELSEYLVTALG